MKHPEWFDRNSTHKSYRFGPIGSGAYIPLCKIVRRKEFPKDGCYDMFDKVSRIWRNVSCEECLKIKERSCE